MASADVLGTHGQTPVHGSTHDESSSIQDHDDHVDSSDLDQPDDVLKLKTDHLYGDDLVGVSISRVQTQLRSPDTPAEERAKALNLSLQYFQRMMALAEETEQENDPKHAADDESGTAYSLLFKDEERSTSPDFLKETALLEVPSRLSNNVSDRHATNAGLEHPWSEIHPCQIQEYQSLPPPPPPTRQPPPPPAEPQHRHHRPNLESWNPVIDGSEHGEGVTTPPTHRSSITKSLLGAAQQRKRSLSASSTLFANLRKLLPDLPSLPSTNSNRTSLSSLLTTSGTSVQDTVGSGSTTPTGRPGRWSTQLPLRRRDTGDSKSLLQFDCGTVHDLTTSPDDQMDGNVESLLAPTSPRSHFSRVRSNSEGSLFLMRRVSGVSAYDDTTAFAHVTDMTNSRFKAITDSFQNSTIKLPRLPAMRPAVKRRISPDEMNGQRRSEGDATTNETESRVYNHHYTTVKKMRNAAKGIEVETPQQRAHPVLSHALSKAEGDIVLLGGYRGSVLRSAKAPHRQLWVPIKVGLNLRKVDLEVGLTREDEERMEEDVIPDGVLSHIGPIDICRRLLKHMKKCPNAQNDKLKVHNWGYDWRLSPDFLSAKLIRFLESLPCNQPETPPERRGAIVLAHSLGGLITRHAVNQRPELFAGVVFAGVPQHCINILGPLRNGDDVLLSSRVLTAQVNFTIRTSFALLPESGRCFIQKHTNQRYDLDFFDPHIWDEYHLSPCIKPSLEPRLKGKDDHRKSIMGALSDSIGGSNRRGSWFGAVNSKQNSPQAENANSLEEAGERLRDKELEARQDIEGNAEGTVGPSIKQSQHRPNIATAVTIPKHVAREYLDRTLAEVVVFKRELRFVASHQENNLYPPHALIFGKSVPTVFGVRVPNKEAIKYADAFDDLAFAAGDGVVLASAAQLPEGYRCVKGGRVETDRGHVGLMGDLEGMGRCIEAVIDARSKGVGLGAQYARRSQELSNA